MFIWVASLGAAAFPISLINQSQSLRLNNSVKYKLRPDHYDSQWETAEGKMQAVNISVFLRNTSDFPIRYKVEKAYMDLDGDLGFNRKENQEPPVLLPGDIGIYYFNKFRFTEPLKVPGKAIYLSANIYLKINYGKSRLEHNIEMYLKKDWTITTNENGELKQQSHTYIVDPFNVS